jgi:hypothetical protein
MSRIETLPPDQRAVLQLLLRQGKPFRDLSGVLEIPEDEVRRRAHGALDALGPDETEALEPDRRAEIADFLLGQQDDPARERTRAFLEGSPAGRAWARVVADQLRALTSEGLPEIPDGRRADGGTDGEPTLIVPPTPSAPVRAAAEPATGGTPSPAAAPPAAEAAAVPLTGAPASDTDAESDAGAGDPSEAAPGLGRLGAPRSSRLGGALLLGGIALVAVGILLFFALRNGGSDSGTPPATTTVTRQPQPQVEAQVNLIPPSSRKGLKALGVVLVQKAQGQDQIVAAVQGLPKPKKGGYGIWLYSGPGQAQWLGFFASQDSHGRLLARGQLKASIADYREVLVTREAKGSPARPGPIFLRGTIQTADSGAG